MAYGLFKVSKDLAVLLNPEAVKLCPDLAFLNDTQVKYLILVYDYVDSPYRKKPLDERKNIAFGKLYKETDHRPEELDYFLKAKDEYISLIYDERREQIEIYNNKIYRLQKKLEQEENTAEVTKISTAITTLRKEKETLERSLEVDEELIELKGGGTLSFIEQWKRNKSSFLARK